MNAAKLNDLEELVLAVREPESRRLLEEAVNAYRGGAFRSALISTWIAVAFDIISKIRELAARGEANAMLFVTDLTNAIDNKNVRRLQEIENALLLVAQTDFAFLLPHEATDLQRLFDDRDLCAHPAFVSDDTLFTPAPELLRAHIAHAVRHLLAHPPVQGKSALLRLHGDLLGSGFPADEASIEIVMRENFLHQTKDSVVVAIAKGLLLTPLRTERAKFKGKERSIALAFAAVGKIRPDLFEREVPTFFRKTADETVEPEFLDLLHFIAAEPRCWQWMGNPSRIRMTEVLRKEPLTLLIRVGCFDALHVSDVSQVLTPRVSSATDEQKFNIISENPRAQFVEEAIQLYSNSGSFRTAELRGEKLILAHAEFFKAEDVVKILSVAAENNQILNAGGTSDVLIKLFDARLDLLPCTEAAWKGLHDALTAKRLLGDYTYPKLVENLHAQGVT